MSRRDIALAVDGGSPQRVVQQGLPGDGEESIARRHARLSVATIGDALVHHHGTTNDRAIAIEKRPPNDALVRCDERGAITRRDEVERARGVEVERAGCVECVARRERSHLNDGTGLPERSRRGPRDEKAVAGPRGEGRSVFVDVVSRLVCSAERGTGLCVEASPRKVRCARVANALPDDEHLAVANRDVMAAAPRREGAPSSVGYLPA